MLKVDHNIRPSVKTMLEYPIVQEMEEKYVKDEDDYGVIYVDEKNISKPLYMPSNVTNLNFKLPKSNYRATEYSGVLKNEILPVDYASKTSKERAYNILPTHVRKAKKNVETDEDFMSSEKYQGLSYNPQRVQMEREKAGIDSRNKSIKSGYLNKYSHSVDPYKIQE